jgi:phosphoglycolate phosphatase
MSAVIFDLDGTLIDSLPDIAASVDHVFSRRGLAPLAPEQIKVMIGDGARVLVNRAFGAVGAVVEEADHAAFETHYTAHSADLTRAYPGIESALRDLRDAGYSLGVCTNKPQAAAFAVLQALGLAGYFGAVTGGNSTPYRKPDPRHLAATLEALGSKTAIMIGDHHNDIAAAEGLGLPAIFAAWGYGKADWPVVASKASEIPGLVASLAHEQG